MVTDYPILGELIAPNNILEIDVSTREQALDAMLERLVEVEPDRESIRHELLEREAMASTALGLGVAVPHIRTARVDDWAFAFARNRRGLEWDSMDGQPVTMVFMLLANQRYALTFVKVISQIVRFVKDGQNRLALVEAGPEELVEALRRIGK